MATFVKDNLNDPPSHHMTIGDMLDSLELIARRINMLNAVVVFDFPGYMYPEKYTSYRGYYEQCALTYSNNKECTVEALLVGTKDVIWKSLEGYKGGIYMMTRDTPLWIANYGNCEGVFPTGLICDGEYRVVIETRMGGL